MQVHYVSQILVCAHEPCLGGLESFLERQATIQNSIEMVCGIGMTLNEDASTMLSSQCMFIGTFVRASLCVFFHILVCLVAAAPLRCPPLPFFSTIRQRLFRES